LEKTSTRNVHIWRPMLRYALMRSFVWVGLLVCGCVQNPDTIGLDADTQIFGSASSPLVRSNEIARARDACSATDSGAVRPSVGGISGVWIQCQTGTPWGLDTLQRIGRLSADDKGDVRQTERAEGTWALRNERSLEFFESTVMFLPQEPIRITTDGAFTRLYAGNQLQLVQIHNLIR
jgi:hypothetical protein